MGSIQNSGHNHVHFTFDNGYTVSVLWGAGSFTKKGSELFHSTNYGFETFVASEDVEVAVFAPDGGWATAVFLPEQADNLVVGYLSIDDLAVLLHAVKEYKL